VRFPQPHRAWRNELTFAGQCVVVVGLAVAAGLLIVLLDEREMRWKLLVATPLVGVILLALTPWKQRVLTALFILSLQVDIYLRFFYGRAGSNEGIAVPLVVVAGAALLMWYLKAGRLHHFTWGGSMRLPILLLFATSLLSLTTSSERFIGATRIWHDAELYFLYWLTFNLIDSDEAFERIIRLLLVILATQAAIYFVQSLTGTSFNFMGELSDAGSIPRPGGTVSSNPAGFTSFIMPALMITCALAISAGNLRSRGWMLGLLLMGTMAIGLSFTRAAWIGFALGFTTIVILGWRRRAIAGSIAFSIAAIACIGAAALLPTMMMRVSEDYGALGDTPAAATIEERWNLMRIALAIIADHPVTGIGPGAYSQIFRGYAQDSDQWLFLVHNEFLLRAAETGIPGAIAFVVLLVVAFRTALRLTRSPPSLVSVAALGWCGGLVALVWQMNWVPWIGWSYNAMLWVMLGLMDGARRIGGNPAASTRPVVTRTLSGRGPRRTRHISG
jgi:O-antigen ligase